MMKLALLLLLLPLWATAAPDDEPFRVPYPMTGTTEADVTTTSLAMIYGNTTFTATVDAVGLTNIASGMVFAGSEYFKSPPTHTEHFSSLQEAFNFFDTTPHAKKANLYWGSYINETAKETAYRLKMEKKAESAREKAITDRELIDEVHEEYKMCIDSMVSQTQREDDPDNGNVYILGPIFWHSKRPGHETHPLPDCGAILKKLNPENYMETFIRPPLPKRKGAWIVEYQGDKR